jgi:hypothetical protein
MSEGALLPFVAGGEMVDLVVVEVVVYDLIDPGIGRGSTRAEAFADLRLELLGVGFTPFEWIALPGLAVADVDVPPAGAFCWVGTDCHVELSRVARRAETIQERQSSESHLNFSFGEFAC